MKPKLLFILHRSPPQHGAAKVGDFISSSNDIKESFDCKFISIKSSIDVSEIGTINIKKIYFFFQLFFKILWSLIKFKPKLIYFTSSIRGFAFYRDFLLSISWKIYGVFKKTEVFYHYHTKGISDFVNSNFINLLLTRIFLKRVNLILLSEALKYDFNQIDTYKKIYYLPNAVEDEAKDIKYDEFAKIKFKKSRTLQILYLSNMIKSKGYFEVLKLAKGKKESDFHFHFAGKWKNKVDEIEFFEYIKKNDLNENVTFHGFVSGEQKKELLKKAHIFIFPSRYPKEAYPLSIIEALSFGIPVIASNEGAISSILDRKSGILIENAHELPEALLKAQNSFINYESSIYCRQRFLKNFNLETFEKNFIKIVN